MGRWSISPLAFAIVLSCCTVDADAVAFLLSLDLAKCIKARFRITPAVEANM